MTYEQHWFSLSDCRIFKRPENHYVPSSDTGFLAWKDQREIVYTLETRQATETRYDEFGQPYEITVEVTIQVPVIEVYDVYNEYGEMTGTATRYQTRLVNTIRNVSCDRFILIVDDKPTENASKAQILADEAYARTHPPPTDAERIDMLEKLIMELTSQ